LPQQYRAWFDERRVNIDDYCVEMGQGEHSATHTMGWNEEIMTALKLVEHQLKRKLKKKEIEREARKLMTKFKIGNLPFIHYEGKDDEDGKK
jgi:hypothetical protein